MQIIQRGAEAILYLDEREGRSVLVKDRVPKGYRIPQLDEKLRTQRARNEESLLLRARRAGVSSPSVLDARDTKIVMEWIDGKRVKDALSSMPERQRLLVYRLIGESVGKLHQAGIVHGDLTTSNMILKGGSLYIIDFGLGKVSGKTEDQAVDLYLLHEALKSTHLEFLGEAWEGILKAYKQNCSKSNEVFNRVLKIERRRRYKGG